MENPKQEQPTGKDSNKIYFLVAVILALLGTNTYLFFKDKKIPAKMFEHLDNIFKKNNDKR